MPRLLAVDRSQREEELVRLRRLREHGIDLPNSLDHGPPPEDMKMRRVRSGPGPCKFVKESAKRNRQPAPQLVQDARVCLPTLRIAKNRRDLETVVETADPLDLSDRHDRLQTARPTPRALD